MGLDKEIPYDFPDPEPYTVSFNGPNDPLHPHNWSTKKKVLQCMLIGVNTATIAWGSSIFSTAILEVAEEFHVGRVVATLGVSLYVLGFATGPVIWAPLSELFGRRVILILSVFGFTLFQFACATAKDLQTVLLSRAFGGMIGAAPLVVVPAAFADLFNGETRGKAITIFSMTVFAMPIIAPVAGAFITYSHLKWRWTEYITGIMGAAGFVLIVFFFEETHHPIILVSKAKEIKKRTGNWLIHAPHDEFELTIKDIVEKNLTRPLAMLVKEPIILLISIYNAFIYGILYLLLSAYPIVFSEGYGMKGGVAQLPYLGVALGMGFGGTYCYFAETYYLKAIKANNGKPVPEARLYPLFAGSIAFPIGLMWFTWTGHYHETVHWMAPTAAGLFIGFGLITVFNSSINYIIDSYLIFAASALAANTFLRSIAACAFPLFSVQMFHNMGTNWAGLLLAGVGFVLIPVPFLFFKYGKRIRTHSKYAFEL
jgi:DHA1 family multidrug resistance protein-like MFS transporter